MDEPPGIEGYVERIKPNTQLKQALYLSTHDGYIFFIAPSQANPPPPPGPPDEHLQPEDLRTAEAIRGGRQILHAAHMCDLRDIVAVRRATQLIPRHTEEVGLKNTPEWEDSEGFWENVESLEEDHMDSGGDEGLAKVSKASDKARLRVRRSFELLTKTGQVVRFEVRLFLAAGIVSCADETCPDLFMSARIRVDSKVTPVDFVLAQTPSS